MGKTVIRKQDVFPVLSQHLEKGSLSHSDRLCAVPSVNLLFYTGAKSAFISLQAPESISEKELKLLCKSPRINFLILLDKNVPQGKFPGILNG